MSSSSSSRQSFADVLGAQQANWMILDGMVVDYAYYFGSIENNGNGGLAEGYAKFQQHLPLLQTIRQVLLEGDIATATEMLQAAKSDILQDRTLAFRLHQQQFVELLRKGATEQAIQFSRDVLSKLVHNSSSQAEFRQMFSLVLHAHEHAALLRRPEWSMARRAELATTVHSRLMASFGVAEPTFALMIRYLCSIHNIYHIMNGVTPLYDEVDRLLLVPHPDEDYFPSMHEYQEAEPLTRQAENDLRSLVQVTSISKSVAQQALTRSKGSISRALRGELCKIQLNHQLLQDLARQYLTFRGLVARPRSSDAATNQQGNLKRKHSAQAHTAMDDSDSSLMSACDDDIQSPLETLHVIRAEIALGTGDTITATIEKINKIKPSFLADNPSLAFRLWQQPVLSAMNAREPALALSLIQQHLSPIAQKSPELVKSVVHLVLMVVYQTSSPSHIPNTPVPSIFSGNSVTLSGAVFTKLAVAMHLEPPLLCQLVLYMLASHTMHYLGDEDRFEALFRLPQLKRPESLDEGNVYTASDFDLVAAKVDNIKQGSSEVKQPPTESSISDDEIRETAIRTLMDVMQYPRERAIDLLRQTDYDLDAVFSELI